jgi:hypothetical protein
MYSRCAFFQIATACPGCQVKAFVRVHEPVRQGQSVMIDCMYDLAGGSLYSINWRFKGREFLRLLKPFNVPVQSASSLYNLSPSSSSPSSSSSSSTSTKLTHQRSSSDRQQYTGRKKPKTTKAPRPPPVPQMNMVFTPVQGIDIDVSITD